MKEDAPHPTVTSSILFFGIKETFLQRQKDKFLEKIRIECRGDWLEISDLVFVSCVREAQCPLYRR
jgi:hypothetical protein